MLSSIWLNLAQDRYFTEDQLEEAGWKNLLLDYTSAPRTRRIKHTNKKKKKKKKKRQFF
jgi:hypothetical protein